MMPMMWMLMAENIMSAITTACFSLSRGAGERAPVERSGACLALSQARSMREGETARGRYAKPHFHHGSHGSGHLPVSWRCRRWAFFISSAFGVLVSVFFFVATKIGWQRYKVYKKWQEHNLHP